MSLIATLFRHDYHAIRRQGFRLTDHTLRRLFWLAVCWIVLWLIALLTSLIWLTSTAATA